MKIKDIDYGISGIYKIIFDNNKIYIGLSNDIRRRMNEHFGRDLKQHPNLVISKAIKKHSLKDIEIIEYLDNDRKLLQEREKYWIKYYNSTNKEIGYNITSGGDGADFGWFNVSASLTENEVNQIYNLLLNTKLTYEEIADIFCSNRKIISDINMGIHYVNNKYNYPLRKNRIEHYGINNKHSIFYNNQELLNDLIKDLKDNILSYKDLMEKYNIKLTTLTNINCGKKYIQQNESYPLRPVDKGKSNRRIFSDEELLFIKEKLEESKISVVEISKILKCDPKVICNINNGRRQRKEDWDYPLRKNKMTTGPKKN